ncbi:hypothetical protein VC82_2218 [Flagellimonas lutaonensis]|uniref:Uncharacterized protein n=1 Tax=Flagellimonas lutaonensis TaxID=516051 RepID=A0A0D5YUA5_9FLAO|nr:hypothetical protein VC82_2218 [Allomuricauda lutaonensis]|tara:strand:+ start:377 stop:529 length:153 start_codon:yes stop_codon:yes gene_type:complete
MDGGGGTHLKGKNPLILNSPLFFLIYKEKLVKASRLHGNDKKLSVWEKEI